MTDEAKKYLPEPVYDAEPSLKDLYYKTWELVDKHVKDIPYRRNVLRKKL